ncbi:MAG: hypothetical protein HYV07_04515 [Deltaproteobacteria bacterium]|nr:hypothetical protein [Deltaproteobacteria bacterium]
MARTSDWLLPVSGAFATSAIATLAAFAIGPGCQTRCFNSFDCGDGSFCYNGRCETECFTDDDCRHPPECQDNPLACQPKGFKCNSVGRCVGRYNSQSPPQFVDAPTSELDVEVDGWDDPPGTGQAFIVDSLAIADRSRGFDIDGVCRGPGDCVDNSLWQLGQLGNDQIRQGLLGGETLLLIEVSGLDLPFVGNDRTITVKFFGARDADDPFFPANNFQIPMGETTCCEFKINPQSIAGIPPQARARAPAKIERGQLKSLAPVPIQFTLTVGVPPHPEIRIERVLLSARVPAKLTELAEGLLGGALPINTLAQTDNPYCKTLNQLCPRQLPDSTLIDLIATILPPDIDLDIPRDGVERLEGGGSGRIEICYDGQSSCDPVPSPCASDEEMKVPPFEPAKPWTCALRPQMADGYSVGITFSAVKATVVGVGQ